MPICATNFIALLPTDKQ